MRNCSNIKAQGRVDCPEHDLFNYIADAFNMCFCQGGMNQKHQTSFSEFTCDPEWLRWPPFTGKRFFQINLAAASDETRDAFYRNFPEDTIAIPAHSKLFRLNKHIIFVIRVKDVAGRFRNTKSWQTREPFRQ